MELTVEKGFGYSLAEDRKAATLGIITVDAVFTPVRRVTYTVAATRVGRRTDLDKLILEDLDQRNSRSRRCLKYSLKNSSFTFYTSL